MIGWFPARILGLRRAMLTNAQCPEPRKPSWIRSMLPPLVAAVAPDERPHRPDRCDDEVEPEDESEIAAGPGGHLPPPGPGDAGDRPARGGGGVPEEGQGRGPTR